MYQKHLKAKHIINAESKTVLKASKVKVGIREKYDCNITHKVSQTTVVSCIRFLITWPKIQTGQEIVWFVTALKTVE